MVPLCTRASLSLLAVSPQSPLHPEPHQQPAPQVPSVFQTCQSVPDRGSRVLEKKVLTNNGYSQLMQEHRSAPTNL